MIILGLASRLLGPGLRAAAMVAAPVAAVLAWGAVENGLATRKDRTSEVRGTH